MKLDLGGVLFGLVGRIQPDRDPSGSVRQFMPQSRFHNAKQVPLNRHGSGPFCRFRVPPDLPYEGVYALTVDGRVVYIGECQHLSERFGPRGYGVIQPRNCFVGGQSTNCKINNLVLHNALQHRVIELWFHPSSNRKVEEAGLIGRLKPEWNAQLR